MSTDRFASSAALVRETDYDRYLAALFARAPARPHLIAVYAFNHAVAKTAETVSQPIAGQIRLQWWRDAIDEIYGGTVRRHDVAEALARTVRVHSLPRVLFDALIDARESDLYETPFDDLAALDAYADATSGHIVRLAARILGAGASLDDAAGEAGVAYAFAGLLRALPFHAARRRLMLPLELLREAGLSTEDIFSGDGGPRLDSVVKRMAERAASHLRAFRAHHIARRHLPAFLPAALVPMYLHMVTAAGFNPFRDRTDVPVHRRQLAMLGAVLRGRI